METIQQICVAGAGGMGQQIALLAAVRSFNVRCTDISFATLELARIFSGEWLAKQIEKNRMTKDEVNAVKSRLIFCQDLETACKDTDFVIEAIVEELTAKRRLYKQLDQLCPSHAILATNSSYIVSSKIADATKRPDKVINMHFFNPALVMKLVEVVKGPHVSEQTINVVMMLSRELGKNPVLVKKEIYGFVVNRFFSAITNEACYLLDQGIASIEDIDCAVKDGLAHPLGPFQLLDLTGIDLQYTVLMEKYRETNNPDDMPSPAIVERYARNEFGRKTGCGFYQYGSGPTRPGGIPH